METTHANQTAPEPSLEELLENLNPDPKHGWGRLTTNFLAQLQNAEESQRRAEQQIDELVKAFPTLRRYRDEIVIEKESSVFSEENKALEAATAPEALVDTAALGGPAQELADVFRALGIDRDVELQPADDLPSSADIFAVLGLSGTEPFERFVNASSRGECILAGIDLVKGLIGGIDIPALIQVAVDTAAAAEERLKDTIREAATAAEALAVVVPGVTADGTALRLPAGVLPELQAQAQKWRIKLDTLVKLDGDGMLTVEVAL